MTAPIRVSVRPDFDALDVTTDGPARTKDGRPWVRWARIGSYSGWYAVGARKPKLNARSNVPGFWEATFSVACACAGGNLDQAHCCGRGILALGGLGVTLRSGYAQTLLHCCFLSNPVRYLDVMAPALSESFVYTKPTDWSPSGIALMGHSGLPLITEGDIRHIVCADSDGVTWAGFQKARAKLWVSCCSELLRDEAMDRAQQVFAEETMPSLLTEATKVLIRWPRQGARDWWQFTHEQQMLWAIALVMALQDEFQTEQLITNSKAAVLAGEDFSAELLLRQMAVEVANHDEAFQERFRMAMGQISELLKVNIDGP